MFLLQAIIFLTAIALGTRFKGMGMGMMGAFGLAIIVFVLRVQPEAMPLDIPIIILSMVTAVGALEAAGGLDFFIGIAEKFIRKYPSRITFLSPLIVYIVTFLSGSGHTIYSVLPIIAKVSKDVGVRPERPLSVSVIAAQQAAIASPISVPTVVALSVLAPLGITLTDLLKVCIPATIIGTIAASFAVNKLGKELHEIDGYSIDGANAKKIDDSIVNNKYAKLSAVLFLTGLFIIVLLGSVKGLRPSWEVNGVVKTIEMTSCLVIMMLSIAGFILIFCKIKPQTIISSTSFSSGVQAAVSILGISWLGVTFVKSNEAIILEIVKDQITQYPWMFSIVLFVVCILLMSQSSTLRLMLPLGISLGMKGVVLLAAIPAVNAVFFLPNYPTILSAVNLDTTGTTRIGKYILNHSFMIPGLVATIVSVAVAYVLTNFIY